jgi:two-component system chemotaxis response regulator CheY
MDRKLNVLLVDDSRTVLNQLEGMLSSIDHVAVVGLAESGAAAIRMTQESMPNLVLMDIVMPGLDGLSALRTIRAKHPQIDVAMVSTLGGSEAKAEEAFRLGACQVIAKPFDAEMIEALIERVLSDYDDFTSPNDAGDASDSR